MKYIIVGKRQKMTIKNVNDSLVIFKISNYQAIKMLFTTQFKIISILSSLMNVKSSGKSIKVCRFASHSRII